jgi:hypothetical protein
MGAAQYHAGQYRAKLRPFQSRQAMPENPSRIWEGHDRLLIRCGVFCARFCTAVVANRCNPMHICAEPTLKMNLVAAAYDWAEKPVQRNRHARATFDSDPAAGASRLRKRALVNNAARACSRPPRRRVTNRSATCSTRTTSGWFECCDRPCLCCGSKGTDTSLGFRAVLGLRRCRSSVSTAPRNGQWKLCTNHWRSW